MAKKDFSKINTGSIYGETIAEATQEPQQTRKERKTYGPQETQELLESLNTTGRKGVHLPRLNLAMRPANYDYVRTMAKISGMTYAQFIDKIITEHRETHGDIYKKAVELRNSL